MHRLRANNPNGFTLVESPAGFTFIESPAGFTLVELLVVISVVLILSGVLIAIINPKVQRDKAEDTIQQSNLEKLATGVESYASVYGKYPLAAEMGDLNNDGKPDSADVQVFIAKHPNNEPKAGVFYYYAVSSDQSAFGTYVPKASSSSSSQCFKYRSTWGKIRECSGANCTGGTDGC